MANAANLVNFGAGGSLAIGDWTYSLGPLEAPAYLPLIDASALYLTSSYPTLAAAIDNPYYSWTRTARAIGAPSAGYFSSVASNGTTSVVVVYGAASATNSAASSTDLANWTVRSMPSNAYWSSVAFGAGTFVAVAQLTSTSAVGAVAASSTNGTTWTSRTLPTNAQWKNIIYANSQFLTVASNGTAAATSPDGTTWTARTMPASRDWNDIAYGAGLYVAIHTSAINDYATSPDGITWTSRTSPFGPSGLSARSIAFGNGAFVLTVSNGALYTSTDGVAWVIRTTPGSLVFSTSTYGGGLFVVLGGGSSADNRAITSTDGKIWTLQTLPSSQIWTDITYTGSAFFATSQDQINGQAFSSVVAPTGQFTLPAVATVTGTTAYVKAT